MQLEVQQARGAALAVLAALAIVPDAVAQSGPRAQWTVEPRTSLVWWQIDPNYGHLWATTCPKDPSWQPGEGYSGEMLIDVARRVTTLDAGHSDSRIPIYPRDAVRPVCRSAVSGTIYAENTSAWTGVRGTVRVLADSLITGQQLRDRYARRSVLQTARYPQITFEIERLENVQAGDTLRADAVGTFTLHGVTQPVRVPVRAWQEAAGLRVTGQVTMPADDLTDVYGISKRALQMGTTLGRWDTATFGVDVILRPAGTS